MSYATGKEAEMATNNGSSDSTNTGTDETSDDQDQQQASTEETSGQEQQQDQSQDDQSTSTDKPADKAGKPDPAKQALLADLHKERKEGKAAKSRVTELEAQVAELAPAKETLDAVQAKYDRLEAFVQQAGGPLGKALDSRTFTKDLFESDKDIADLVKDWHKANPSATSTALGSAAAAPAPGKVDVNALLRAAANK